MSRAGEAMLHVIDLQKSFGALRATDGLNLEVMPGECHAVIGPNGAGKTTLIGQLMGEITPDAGRILFQGRDIAALQTHERALMGLARSFQITSILKDFTARDNVAMAVQARQGHSFRFWGKARADAALTGPAMDALHQVGLADRADTPAASLAHGEQRQLELAMALAMRPTLLLLDEPMAGMGVEDTTRMVGVLQALKGSVTMVLVEHDMDAVFALADRISVLVYGKVIASDVPERIRESAEVRQAYLGEEGAV